MILVTGITGQLGFDVVKELERRGESFIGTTRKAVSLRNRQALTDNYLTIKNIDKQNSIFDVVIK